MCELMFLRNSAISGTVRMQTSTDALGDIVAGVVLAWELTPFNASIKRFIYLIFRNLSDAYNK